VYLNENKLSPLFSLSLFQQLFWRPFYIQVPFVKDQKKKKKTKTTFSKGKSKSIQIVPELELESL